MPSQGYATIGLKPAILAKLQEVTDKCFPGMFLPSALIIMMNEIKRGYYSVNMYNIREDFSGRYTSLTIRSDVKAWFDENYEKLKEDYNRKYSTNSFTQFAGIFMLNMFESRAEAQNYVIRLKEADFRWLVEEYNKRKQEYRARYGAYTFEQFADVFLKELLEKVNAARKILTT
ncbi:MAG TPA: SPOR domain-containing protein [Nitrososphaera sp.]|nr:SPOR domain-containing protein [Nitrososphaera sp.]